MQMLEVDELTEALSVQSCPVCGAHVEQAHGRALPGKTTSNTTTSLTPAVLLLLLLLLVLLQNIASISAGNDDSVGEMIADALDKVGSNGVLSIESSNR
jgi:chaperonin GroEL (HSP60 family)